jgi:hypothetical protein
MGEMGAPAGRRHVVGGTRHRDFPYNILDPLHDSVIQAKAYPPWIYESIRAGAEMIAKSEDELEDLVPCPLREEDANALMEITIRAESGEQA